MQSNRTFKAALVLVSSLLFPVLGCSENLMYTRDADMDGLDEPAMSTRMDRRDLQRMLHENLSNFAGSAVSKQWEDEGDKPTLAIFPIANETSEHIDGALQALLSESESYMVNSQLVTVVSRERQDQMIKEVKHEHTPDFDPARINEYGKQLGVKYCMTGKVYDVDERNGEQRRVQYFLSMQIIEVATSAVVWQKSAGFTKALVLN